MPCVGLVNLHGENIPYDKVIPTYRFEDWGQSLPKLALFLRGKRIYRGSNIFASATQLIKPIRPFWMEQKYDWYETPEEQVALYLGTKTHLLFEQSAASLQSLGWITEIPLYVPVDIDGREVRVGLMPDSIDLNSNTLFDYKVSKAWKARKARFLKEWDPYSWPNGSCSDWTLQLSIYKWGLEHPDKIKIIVDEYGENPPEYEKWEEKIEIKRAILDVTVKDHNRRDSAISATETYYVPVMSFEETDKWIKDRLRTILKYEKAEKSSDYEDCKPGEIWLPEETVVSVWKEDGKAPSYTAVSKSESEAIKEAQEKLDYYKTRYPNVNYRLIVQRPIPKRCMAFCEVAKHGLCSQLMDNYPDIAHEPRSVRSLNARKVCLNNAPAEEAHKFRSFIEECDNNYHLSPKIVERANDHYIRTDIEPEAKHLFYTPYLD